MKTQEDVIEELCLADYEAHKYKILLASIVSGYVGETSADILCDPPARVRVMGTSKNDITHWPDDEWCDPYWDVELIEPHPALENARSLWVFGISHNIHNEIMGSRDWRLDENQEPPYQPREPLLPKNEVCPPVTRTLMTACPHCGASLAITIGPQEA